MRDLTIIRQPWIPNWRRRSKIEPCPESQRRRPHKNQGERWKRQPNWQSHRAKADHGGRRNMYTTKQGRMSTSAQSSNTVGSLLKRRIRKVCRLTGVIVSIVKAIKRVIMVRVSCTSLSSIRRYRIRTNVITRSPVWDLWSVAMWQGGRTSFVLGNLIRNAARRWWHIHREAKRG